MIIYIILWSCFGICIIGGLCEPIFNLYCKYKLKFLMEDFNEKMCEYIEGPEGVALKLAGKQLNFKYTMPKEKVFFIFRSKKIINNLRNRLKDELRLSYIGNFVFSKYSISIYYDIIL